MTKDLAFYLLNNENVYLSDEGKRYLKDLLENQAIHEVK